MKTHINYVNYVELFVLMERNGFAKYLSFSNSFQYFSQIAEFISMVSST